MHTLSILLALALPLTLALNELRILGGQAALPGQYNATALVLVATSAKQTTVCGGTLISPRTVLTAAHCVQSLLGDNYKPEQFTVGVGQLSSEGFNLTHPYFVNKTIAHPSYSADIVSNDIGLILLNSSVPANVSTPMKIIKGYDWGARLVATGYGQTTNQKGSLATQLMAVELRLGNMTHCKSLNPHWKQDTQMCTDGTVGRDTCNADSGGPLMGQYNDAGDWGLVGVTSYGEEGKASSGGNMCGTEGGAGFYTYAAYYADWIAQNAGLERDKILVVNSTTVHPNATLMAEASEGSTVLAVASESLTSAAAAGPASGIAAVVAAAVHIAMCLALA